MISSTQTNQPFTGDQHSASTYHQKALERLRANGLRITQARVKLLFALATSEQPLTIEELHAAVSSDCDVVTVYRCMIAFEDLDLVRRSYRHNGTTLYERNLGKTPRYRVVCKVTNRAENLDLATTKIISDAIETVEDALRARGYSSVSHLVEFFGINVTTLRKEAALQPAPLSERATNVDSPVRSEGSS
jgi:Fur family ferric uptake transcriptional regulator